MHAVIKTGGKQYKVAVGDTLRVEKLTAKEGDKIKIDSVLAVVDGEKTTIGAPLVKVLTLMFLWFPMANMIRLKSLR
jgi:large subunit ribosomal protein L21